MAWALLAGETVGVGGVVDTNYPPGHVQRYTNGAVFHDAATIAGNTNTSTTIDGVSAGDIAKLVVGQSIVDVTSFATNHVPANATIATIGANSFTISAAATGTAARTFRVGTSWQSVTAFAAAIKDNQLHPRIEIDWGVGEIYGGWNFGWDYSGTRDAPARHNFNNVKFGGVAHFLEGLSYLIGRGRLTSYDRIGIASAAPVGSVAFTSGNATLVGVAGDFSAIALGAMVMHINIRTGQGEIIAKAVDGSTATLDQVATASGTFAVVVGTNHLQFDTVVGGHNPTKNTSVPGRGYRGHHIVAPSNLSIRRNIVHGCDQTVADYSLRPGTLDPGATPIAAMHFELGGSRNIKVDDTWLMDSATHGLHVSGGLDIDFGKIRIDGGVSLGIAFPAAGAIALPESTATQSNQGTLMWFNRVSGHIGRYEVRQKHAAPSPALLYGVLFEDTGRSIPANQVYKELVIGSGYVEVGSPTAGLGAGVHFGNPDTTSEQMRIKHGRLEVMMREGYTLRNATDAMVTFNPTNSTISDIRCPDIVCINPGGYTPVKGTSMSGEKKVLVIGLDVQNMDTASRLCDMGGHVAGDIELIMSVRARMSVGSFGTAAVGSFTLFDKLLLHDTMVNSTGGGVNTTMLRITDCKNVALQRVKGINMRGAGAGGAIQFAYNTDVSLDDVDLTCDAPGAGFYGIHLDVGTHTRYRFRGVITSLFGVGLKKNAGAVILEPILMEKCHAIGCTTPSDVPAHERVRIA